MKTTLLVTLIIASIQFTGYSQDSKTNGSPAIEAASTPAPAGGRFKDSGKGVIDDTKTELMWTKCANPAGRGLGWDEALDYIKSMNTGSVTNFGYTDWRLPTVDELIGLFVVDQKQSVIPFTDIQGGWCWSSTTMDRDGSKWFKLVGVGSGTVWSTDQPKIGLLWPVRSGRR